MRLSHRLFLSLSLSSIAVAQCLKIRDELEACPGFPGVQQCQCFHSGGSCDATLVPHFENMITSGFLKLDTHQTYCYLSYKCGSLYGGPCDPMTNPCDQDPTPAQIGVWYSHSFNCICDEG